MMIIVAALIYYVRRVV